MKRYELQTAVYDVIVSDAEPSAKTSQVIALIEDSIAHELAEAERARVLEVLLRR